MQLTALTAAALVALLPTALATVNGTVSNSALGVTRVHNRCSYKVYLWSVQKEMGCQGDKAVVLEPGQMFLEGYRTDSATGVSVKISKSNQCKGVDSTQLEYFIQSGGDYEGNYLDVSYVDCTGGDCPTRKEGYYLKSGNQIGVQKANSNNEHCPVLSCSSAAECAKMSYVLPDDRQTKFCTSAADLDFYMCGGEEPGSEPAVQQPAASSQQQQSSPSPSAPSTPSKANNIVAAAAVTSAPAAVAPAPLNIKTEVVYVTKYEYVNAKRHAHGHRHQHFRA